MYMYRIKYGYVRYKNPIDAAYCELQAAVYYIVDKLPTNEI